MAQAKVKTTTKKKTVSKKETVVKSTVEKKSVSKKADFAVIAISGTQLKIRVGERYEVEKLNGNKGDKIEVKEVLLTSNGEKIVVGKPYIKNAKVVLVIDSQLKGEKIEGFKYKAKARSRKRFGYRAELTRVTVKSIE